MTSESPSRTSSKRPHGEINDEDEEIASESSSDDGFGPALPSEAPKKKKRKLPHEKLYISALPNGQRYSKSLMHRDQLSFVTVTPVTDFLITSSADGVVKFWKKAAVGIESVKEFRAHQGQIKSVTISQDGRSFASAGADKTIKVFDVITFDLLSIVQLDYTPKAVCYVHRRGASLPLLAVSTEAGSEIRIYDGRGENQTPLHTLSQLHKKPVHAIAYNNAYDCAVSADENGMIEYWDPSTYEKPDSVFKFKSSTDLFDFKKSKSLPTSITISPSGAQFATFSFPDRKVRVFDFATGKLYRSYDESLSALAEMQQAGTALQTLDQNDFTRRMTTERDLESSASPTAAWQRSAINVIFDESSHFILYPTPLGIKVLNTLTNRAVRLYGATDAYRPLQLALYQGFPQKKTLTTVAMAASSNPLLQEAEERDPLLVSTGMGRQRFYMYTNESEVSKSSRDVQNERPGASSSDANGKSSLTANNNLSSNPDKKTTRAVMHTTLGDIHLILYTSLTPLTVQNFTTHARQGYYNNTLIHRVIPKFMIQGGDPLGDGTGGESIWGGEFKDEIDVSRLKHDRMFTLSMANPGHRDGNGSQWFITTCERAEWLDGKHTVFGRVELSSSSSSSGGDGMGGGGGEVVKAIERIRCVKERPVEEVKVVSIDVLD